MNKDKDKIYRQVKPVKVVLPILIGLGVVIYFFINDYIPGMFSGLYFSYGMVFLLFFAFLMMIIRDFGYIVRIKILSDNKLSGGQSFNIIMLWEFTSAITPSAVGGTSVATYFLWREGFSVGKSAAIVMATSFLDELYFSLLFPILFLIYSKSGLFDITNNIGVSIYYFAIIGYSIKLLWTLLMAYSLFIRPQYIKQLLISIFKFKFLKKWKEKGDNIGNDLVHASQELKTKNIKFWLKAFLATFFSWTARYWVLNFLILSLIIGFQQTNANSLLSFGEHLLIFARQLVMWIMMLVMPTPGGSGFVEAIFNNYMREFIPITGFVGIMAIIWRFVTYYPYLIIGAIITPKWFSKKRAEVESPKVSL